MTTIPSIDTPLRTARMASTAAPSAASLSPRPIQRAAAMAAASVTRTSSMPRLRSGCSWGALAVGEAAAPAATAAGDRVAFVLQRDDRCDIAVVPADGSAWPVRLSTGADWAFDPAWSPDGRSLAWHEWDFPAMPWDASRIVVRG